MMFRILCVALFACSLTFVGCDEASDGMNDAVVTTEDALDSAGENASELAADAEVATVDAADAVEEETAEAAEAVEETVSE